MQAAAKAAVRDDGRDLFEVSAAKWAELPTTAQTRTTASELLSMSDAEIRAYWARLLDPAMNSRFPYQQLYEPHLRGKRVLEIGSGVGVDALFFSKRGAEWHCVDIVEDNLRLVERVFMAFDLPRPGTTLMRELSDLEAAPYDVDAVLCSGSMLHAPFSFAQEETHAIAEHLRPGGRWLELTYPRSRWIREGRPPFSAWGAMTDGAGTPWAEWYDLDKIAERFAPTEVSTNIAFDFAGGSFNWFDLSIPAPPQRSRREDARPSAVTLDQTTLHLHNGTQAQVRESRIDATGPPEIWAYAMDFPVLDLCDAAAVRNSGSHISLAIDLEVSAGVIGVMAVETTGGSLGSQISAERFVSADEGTVPVFFSKLHPPDTAIVFRTAGGSAEPTNFHVGPARVYPAGDAPAP